MKKRSKAKTVKAWALGRSDGSALIDTQWTKESATCYALGRNFSTIQRIEIKEIRRGKK